MEVSVNKSRLSCIFFQHLQEDEARNQDLTQNVTSGEIPIVLFSVVHFNSVCSNNIAYLKTSRNETLNYDN